VRGRWQALALWLGSAAVLAGVIYVFGHRQYGAFDDNIVVDTAWRMFSGQRPYADFMIPLSPEFYLGAGWAFRLFGVSWSALVWMSVAMATVTFAMQSVALAQVTDARYAIGVSLACQFLAMVVTSYWWYNSNASIAACVLFSIAYALVRRPDSTRLVILYAVAVAMIGLMKVNIAALSIAVTAATLFTIKPLRVRVIASVCVGAAAMLALLWFCRLSPLDILHAYAAMAGKRGRPDPANIIRSKPNELFMVFPLVAGFALCAGRALYLALRSPEARQRREWRPQVLLAISALLLAVLLMCMSTEETMISGLPLVLLATANFVYWTLDAGIIAGPPGRSLTASVALCCLASLVGFAIFNSLSDDSFIGPGGFSTDNRAWLMQWTLLVVSAAGIATAGAVRGFGHEQLHRLAAAVRPRLLTGRALVLIVIFLVAATDAFWNAVPLLASVVDARTGRGQLAYLGAMAGWAAIVSPVIVTAVLSLRSSVTLRWNTVIVLLLATSTLAAGCTGARRLRVRINGPGLFYSDYLLETNRHPLFAGMTTYSYLQSTLDAMDSALAEYRRDGYETNDVFFGIRLEFGYAAFRVPSPTHLPVWWDPAASYPLRDEPAIIANFIAHRFPICVFFGERPDFTYLPTPIVSYLKEHYTFHPRRYITVLTRNPEPAQRSRN